MTEPFFLLAQEKLTLERMPSLGAIAPEAFLCAMVLLVLLVDLFRGRGPSSIYPRLTIVGIVVAFAITVWPLFQAGANPSQGVGYGAFEAMRVDDYGRLFKMVFLATGALTILFVGRSGAAYGKEVEFSMLMFGALAGMCYLASATDILNFVASIFARGQTKK